MCVLENLGIYLMGSVAAPYPSQEHLWGSASCVWVTPVCVPHCTSPGSSLGRVWTEIGASMLCVCKGTQTSEWKAGITSACKCSPGSRSGFWRRQGNRSARGLRNSCPQAASAARLQSLNHFSHLLHKTDDFLENGLFVSQIFLPSCPGL